MKELNKALFLHGGPGLHAAVERAWFGDLLPVLWWDQPAVAADNPAPFRSLVASAAGQLQALADSSGQRIDLIAHSFGWMLAAALAKEHPALIRRITLLAYMPIDPFRPFLYLGQKMIEAGYERPGLQAAMKAAQETPDRDRFAALIQACFPDPYIPDIYFGPSPASIAAKQRYLALAGIAPPVDVATFFAVVFDMLHTKPLVRVEEFAGEVVMLLGEHDPLLHADESIKELRGIFPQAQLRMVDAGHFLQFELPPETWLGHP